MTVLKALIFQLFHLKQVEVLRDGAAAQYGSDAIAGVMNFVLKDDADGGSLTARYGSHYEGDGDTTEVSGNIGMPLTKDGFINLSFQYKNADATSRSLQRPDAAAIKKAGNAAVSDLAQVWGSPKVSDDITIFANLGLDLGNDSEAYMFGNFSERDVRGGFYYRNPHTRGGVYGGNIRTADIEDGNGSIRQYRPSTPADYVFSDPDDKRTPEQIIWDDVATPTLLVGDTSENADPFSCPEVTVENNKVLGLDALPANCFTHYSALPGGFTPNFGGNIVDTSITMGTRGELDNGVMYDVSGSIGFNESSYVIYDTVNSSLGSVTPRDFNPGKHTQLEKTFNLDFNKDIDVESIDSLMVAGGYEWHAESFEVTAGGVDSFTAGPLTDQGFGIGSNGFPGFKPEAAGKFSRQNFAFYVDTEAQITEDFLLGAALRYEDYSTFGSDINYKITAQYNVTDDFSLRSSISSGFRAPTVGQANYANVQTALEDGKLVDSALLPATNPVAQQLGAQELTPEQSKSYTLGAVWNVGELFMTLDYYNIAVTDRVSQSTKYALTELDKDTLTEAGVANVESIQLVSFFTNDFDTTTSGVDLIANYAMEMFNGDSTFSLAYNYNKTEVDRFSDVTGDFKVSRLENDLPNHRATFTWSQKWEQVSLLLRGNYYGEYQGVHVDYDATINTGDAAITLDAELSYFVSDDIVLSVGAQNLLDQKATKINFTEEGAAECGGCVNNQFGGVYYETSPFGFNGGFYYVKATYSF
jgi:iron complex outermembrane receptor protein